MQIITTTTIHVSEGNLWIVPYIIEQNGGLMENETSEDAIIRLRNEVAFDWAYNQIRHYLPWYFWVNEKAKALYADEMLRTSGITTETQIINE